MIPLSEAPEPTAPDVRIGHVHLKVADLDRAIGFYSGVLGFDVMQRFHSGAAFLAAGGYHHHLGLNIWESAGGTPPPPGHTGLYHTAFPTVDAAAQAGRLLRDAGLGLVEIRPLGRGGREDRDRAGARHLEAQAGRVRAAAGRPERGRGAGRLRRDAEGGGWRLADGLTDRPAARACGWSAQANPCPKSNEAGGGVSRRPRRVRLSGAELTGYRTRR